MILHTDIPTRRQVDRLFRDRDPNRRIQGSEGQKPEVIADAELAERARVVLDELYADQVRQLHELYECRVSEGRTLLDLGAVMFGEAGPDRYGVVDEMARRVWLTGGRVLAVRSDDIPGPSAVAAILRYPPAVS